jgi:hypothetical protein
MEAHAWHSGKDLGYVAFIYKFFRDSGLVNVQQIERPVLELPEASERRLPPE